MLTHGNLVANLWGILEGYMARDQYQAESRKLPRFSFLFPFLKRLHSTDSPSSCYLVPLCFEEQSSPLVLYDCVTGI